MNIINFKNNVLQLLDRSSYDDWLQELSELLKDNNLRAKTLAQIISSDISSSEYSEQWNELLKSLTELDFESAQSRLDELAKDLGISL